MRHLLTCAIAALGLAGATMPLGAPDAQAAPKQTICMARTTIGPGGGRAFAIPVPPENVAAMQARGFAQSPCQGRQNSVPKFRKEICRLASAPPPIQARFQATYGATPMELCAMADGILGN
jgi:hypothetical protein